jgi:hydrogenase maturation factor
VTRDASLVPACDADHCITCADEGVPMTVERVNPDEGLAVCRPEGRSPTTVEIDLVSPVELGDRVLVHAGVALIRLEETAA